MCGRKRSSPSRPERGASLPPLFPDDRVTDDPSTTHDPVPLRGRGSRRETLSATSLLGTSQGREHQDLCSLVHHVGNNTIEGGVDRAYRQIHQSGNLVFVGRPGQLVKIDHNDVKTGAFRPRKATRQKQRRTSTSPQNRRSLVLPPERNTSRRPYSPSYPAKGLQIIHPVDDSRLTLQPVAECINQIKNQITNLVFSS